MRISKSAHCNGDDVWTTFEFPVDRGAAVWTEMEREFFATVAGSPVALRQTGETSGGARKPRISAEHAASALLTFQTVTDRDANRFGGAIDL